MLMTEYTSIIDRVPRWKALKTTPPPGDEASPKSFLDQNIAKLNGDMKNVDKKLYRV